MNKSYFYSALGQAAPNIVAIAKGQAAMANILSVTETDLGFSNMLMSGLKLPRLAGEIEFRNVHFAYPTWRKLLFEGLSFSIPTGKSFAIIGRSGSGKSTIISLLQRLCDPYTGIFVYFSSSFLLEKSGNFPTKITISEMNRFRTNEPDKTLTKIPDK